MGVMEPLCLKLEITESEKRENKHCSMIACISLMSSLLYHQIEVYKGHFLERYTKISQFDSILLSEIFESKESRIPLCEKSWYGYNNHSRNK